MSRSPQPARTGAVVLAAGKGTRFHSHQAKVLHTASGRTLLRWVLEALRPLALERVVVVVGHEREAVRAEAERAGLAGLVAVEQTEQRGTGHAVHQALQAGVLDACEQVLVVPGDAPLLDSEILSRLLAVHRAGVTVLTTRLPDPSGYGRVLRGDDGTVRGIVEQRDATDDQRTIDEVNTSIYVFDREPLARALEEVGTDNAQGEQYLTDAVAPLSPVGISTVEAPPDVVAGVNDRVQLAEAAAHLRARVLTRLMRSGVTVTDPSTTYIDADVTVEPDAVVLPGTHLEGATHVARGAVVGPHTRLVDTTVAEGAAVTYSVVFGASVGPAATVGPFTYLRPGTRLEARAKAGAFVEMKKAHVGEGSKVPHLSYMGDVRIGVGANVGAGTITCNFDGYDKHETVIGDGAFIGSDTMLVAPVEVGARAVTGAASAITKDVPDEALAVERSEQRTVHGWAARRRAQAEHD